MLLLLTFACTNDPGPDVAWISPADGQTGVPGDLPVRVGIAGPWPSDYPLAGAISVWDAAGQPIEGETDNAGDVAFFMPAEPWENDARFVWRWGFDEAPPHGPKSEAIGPAIDPRPSTYTFVVGGAIELLGIALRGDKTPCVIASAPAGDVPFDRLRVGGEDIAFFDVYRDTGGRDDLTASYPGGDPGVDVLCFGTATPLTDRVGEAVLVNYAGRSWSGTLSADIGALLAEVRRLAPREESTP